MWQLAVGLLSRVAEAKWKRTPFARVRHKCMREETRVATRIGLAEQDTTVKKTRAIEEAIEQTDILKADIEKYTSDAAQLTNEIVAHKESLYRPATAKARRKFERQED